jgi:hypothetical protein
MLCRPIGDDVILGVINMDGKEEELLEDQLVRTCRVRCRRQVLQTHDEWIRSMAQRSIEMTSCGSGISENGEFGPGWGTSSVFTKRTYGAILGPAYRAILYPNRECLSGGKSALEIDMI